MMDKKNALLAAAMFGITLASSEVLANSPKPSSTSEAKGICMGGNSCKGTSLCHTATNSCAGTNSCKGKGWIKSTEKECKDKKGTFTKS